MAKCVLVVDDDMDFQEAAEVILSGSGYKVAKAASGAEAMQALRSQHIDLVLLDVMMESDTEGFHLAYAMREDAKLKSIPIIMLTSIEKETGVDLNPEESEDYLPVDAFLRKPLDPKALKSKLAELL